MKEQYVLKTFHEAQGAYAQFSRGINIEATPLEIHELMVGEVVELGQALKTGNRQEIAGELADVVHYAIELANQHGIQLDEAVSSKLQRNYTKYNPIRMNLLTSNGISQKRARDILKKLWNRENDKKF